MFTESDPRYANWCQSHLLVEVDQCVPDIPACGLRLLEEGLTVAGSELQ
jgi:hypothetical protein